MYNTAKQSKIGMVNTTVGSILRERNKQSTFTCT